MLADERRSVEGLFSTATPGYNSYSKNAELLGRKKSETFAVVCDEEVARCRKRNCIRVDVSVIGV